jgi:hypothetical protein
MASRFGEEYRPQHNGSDPFRMPRMKRTYPDMSRTPGDVNPQIRPANERQWSDSGDRESFNNPSPMGFPSFAVRRLQTQSYQEDDERGSYTQSGANKKYHFEKKKKNNDNKYTEDGDNKKDKPNDKDSGGGSKVPRKPKPNTPSGGLKKPTPTKASK